MKLLNTLLGLLVTTSLMAAGSLELQLKTRSFDPLKEKAFTTHLALEKMDSNEPGLFIIQYKQAITNEMVEKLKGLGIQVRQFIPSQAHLVKATPSAIEKANKLGFVRWSGQYTPDFKLSDTLRENIVSDSVNQKPARYNVVLVDKADRTALKSAIKKAGGKVVASNDGSVLVEAELTSQQLDKVAQASEVLWIDPSTKIEEDVDNAREQGGANYLTDLRLDVPNHFTGIGIRGHVMEGIEADHPEFEETTFRKAPIAVEDGTASSHGHQTYGIVFGSGLKNKKARGLLPNAQGFYTSYDYVYSTPAGNKEGKSRYALVEKLIKEKQIMFQTASWGYATTEEYDSRSLEMDDLIFNLDIPITQSQSNTGSKLSRPQAWAKNIISIGALYHFDNADPNDDKWNESGSIGPAADGRVKPDLCAFFDKIFTTSMGKGYTENFGGTSGATPIVAGHVGLTIEMWTDGLFGNKLDFPVAERFKNRPHFTTVKALLINLARQYKFEGEADDRTRVHQGWGFPNLKNMFDQKDSIIVVNETDVLKAKESKKYTVEVAEGSPELKTTMIFADPPGSPSAKVTRVNNLDLKVTDPSGKVSYWGNNGLLARNYSAPGGEPNSIDPVENVFVQNPAAGNWTVEVIATEVNQDGHLETKDVLDADYALVISGGAKRR